MLCIFIQSSQFHFCIHMAVLFTPALLKRALELGIYICEDVCCHTFIDVFLCSLVNLALFVQTFLDFVESSETDLFLSLSLSFSLYVCMYACIYVWSTILIYTFQRFSF